MKRSTRPNMFAYVRPWIWLRNRFSSGVAKAKRVACARPSGRNFIP